MTGPHIYGRVFDASDDQPLAEVTITVAGVETEAETDADGRFMMVAPDEGSYDLAARITNYTYAQRRAEVRGDGPGVVKDMYFTPLDAQAIRIGPAGGRGTNADGLIELQVPAGALSADAELRATWYNRDRDLPNDLPELSHFTYACDLTPDGQDFAAPATVLMRNTRGFAPGTPIPVGVYDSDSLSWEHESMGVVSDDGDWVEYEVRHFSPRDCNLGRTSPAGGGEPGDAEDTTSEQRAERNDGRDPMGEALPAGTYPYTLTLVNEYATNFATVGQQRHRSGRRSDGIRGGRRGRSGADRQP